MMRDVAGRFGGVEAADRVADRDPLIQRGERAAPEPVAQRWLAEQQQGERRRLIHPEVAQAAHALKRLGVEEVRLVDDQHDLFAALAGFGDQQLLGLGDQRGMVKPGRVAQRGDDQPVDAAQPDTGGAEVEDRVPGGVKTGDRRAGGDRLAGAALAADHADRLLS